MKMTNIELAEKALAVYNDRKNWTYCQGGLGELGESERIRNLYNYFRQLGGNSMTMDYLPWLEQYGKGKHCTDCSNFINYLIWGRCVYSTDGFAAMPACPSLQDAPVGAILCMKGHVGIVVEKGIFIDFYAYNNTCRKGKISESLFEKAVYCKDIEYVDAVPVKLEIAAVSKKRYIGDKLTYDDLVAKVTLSDGKVLINPQGWLFTPTELTNTSNVIAGTYKRLVDYVNVPAEVKGTFYAVQIPAISREDAVRLQQKLSAEGYAGAAVVELK